MCHAEVLVVMQLLLKGTADSGGMLAGESIYQNFVASISPFIAVAELRVGVVQTVDVLRK